MTGQLVPSGHLPDNRITHLHRQWAERHGVEAADRLVSAEELADAVAEQLVPQNTVDTYDKSWRVWQRFCDEQRFPEMEGSRGALVAFVLWMLREGRGATGYAPNSAGTHLAGVVVRLRKAGVDVSKDDAAEARVQLKKLATELKRDGERRGRGQAPAAHLDGIRQVAVACPDSLAGLRDRALVLLSFHVAARASEPAGLLAADVVAHERGLRVSVVVGKTELSVREVAVPYATDPTACPVRAYLAWRAALEETDPRFTDSRDPAFHGIDRWGHVGGAMSADAVTAVIARAAERAGIPLRWTGHSLRSGLATASRAKGKDALVIAAQGGWVPNSKSMMGYMRRADEWEDNASAGLA
ncbi:tyrosine-type recombinase/integrase [Streptomyces lonarensis]|uniref:Tyrosine-type recombinase/integrase n=2 Tax=Streptomyces lonarensis TaxID=700599 RepID=A0A7X6HXL8_9ACTN|nr:tyrosine-type recombinase/integrase [Streptomyces lonarensis]